VGRCTLHCPFEKSPDRSLYWKLRYFCYRYLKINAIKQYFLEILQFFHRYIQKQVHLILSGYIQIWHFYRTLSRGYFFPGHSVQYADLQTTHTRSRISPSNLRRGQWPDGYMVVEISFHRFLEGIYRRRVSFMGR